MLREFEKLSEENNPEGVVVLFQGEGLLGRDEGLTPRRVGDIAHPTIVAAVNRFSTMTRQSWPHGQSFNEPFLPLVAPAGDADEAEPQALTGRLPSYIADHRQRLRDRFMQGGGAALPDYELLELVLFRAIPRQDVKPLARLLLDTFGDFNRVITASPARLQMVKGAGPAVVLELKLVEAAAQRMMRARVIQKPLLSSPGTRFSTTATPPWRTARPNSSASCSLTARTC